MSDIFQENGRRPRKKIAPYKSDDGSKPWVAAGISYNEWRKERTKDRAAANDVAPDPVPAKLVAKLVKGEGPVATVNLCFRPPFTLVQSLKMMALRTGQAQQSILVAALDAHLRQNGF